MIQHEWQFKCRKVWQYTYYNAVKIYMHENGSPFTMSVLVLKGETQFYLKGNGVGGVLS